MYVFKNYKDIREHIPFCVALGSFDGLHLGHQTIIKKVVDKASSIGANSLVYTFSDHPRKVLEPSHQISLITTNRKRTEILEKLGLYSLYLEEFKTIINMSPEEFVKEVLINNLNAKHVFVGYNYHFGYKASGDVNLLSKLGKKYGFSVEVFNPIKIENKVISSSLIRELILQGNVHRIPEYLGRFYSIEGSIIHGKQNGKIMGIRTANVKIDDSLIIPIRGVYLSNTIVNSTSYKSITNIGYNPTFYGDSLSIETHLLNFQDNLYGSNIEVYFLKRIRDEKQFENVDSLVKQIRMDIQVRIDYHI